MKNKTVIILLSVLAVALYTTAVINFRTVNVFGGIAEVLMGLAPLLVMTGSVTAEPRPTEKRGL